MRLVQQVHDYTSIYIYLLAFRDDVLVLVNDSPTGEVLDDLLEASAQRLACVAAPPRGVAHLDDLARHHIHEDVLDPRPMSAREVVLVRAYLCS